MGRIRGSVGVFCFILFWFLCFSFLVFILLDVFRMGISFSALILVFSFFYVCFVF